MTEPPGSSSEDPSPSLGPAPRSNGLRASHYVRLTDIDPRMGPVLLEALLEAGIAAYLQPVLGSVGGYLEIRPPDRPTDRLFVDPERVTAARAVVQAELQLLERHAATETTPRAEQSPAPDIDQAWGQIVAGWDRKSDSPVPRWPVEEDLGDPDAAAEPDRGRSAADRVAGPGPGTAALADPDPDDEHFVPPPAPPLPRLSGAAMGGLALLALGGVLLFVPSFLGLDQFLSVMGPRATLTAGIAAVMAGTGILIWRVRDHPSDNESGDGAVV